jgi:hypothetical protein
MVALFAKVDTGEVPYNLSLEIKKTNRREIPPVDDCFEN